MATAAQTCFLDHRTRPVYDRRPRSFVPRAAAVRLSSIRNRTAHRAAKEQSTPPRYLRARHGSKRSFIAAGGVQGLAPHDGRLKRLSQPLWRR